MDNYYVNKMLIEAIKPIFTDIRQMIIAEAKLEITVTYKDHFYQNKD